MSQGGSVYTTEIGHLMRWMFSEMEILDWKKQVAYYTYSTNIQRHTHIQRKIQKNIMVGNILNHGPTRVPHPHPGTCECNEISLLWCVLWFGTVDLKVGPNSGGPNLLSRAFKIRVFSGPWPNRKAGEVRGIRSMRRLAMLFLAWRCARPREWPAREWRPQSYSHKDLNSGNSPEWAWE